MNTINDSISGARIPENRQGGAAVPGSPRSGLRAESCDGPRPDDGLPAGPHPGRAITDSEEKEVQSILDYYLGPIYRALSIDNEDNMSISGSTSKKRMRERESLSDSDLDVVPIKGHKVLRSRVIGSDSGDGEDPIVLSDSSVSVAGKVRGRKTRMRKLEKLDNMDDSFESSRAVFTDCPSHLAYADLNDKNVDELAMVSDAWLNDMATIRSKFKRINGKFFLAF